MGRRLSGLLSGSLVLTGAAVLGPSPAAAVSRDLFAPYTATMPGSSPADVATGDVTGDGRRDVVMTTDYVYGSPANFSLFVYPQRSDGTLGAPTQIVTHGAYGSSMGIALGDLDADGDLDAAVTTSAGVEVYRQGAGGLAYAWTAPVDGGHDPRLVDISGDGLVDLVVGNGNGIQVWWQVNGDLMPSPKGAWVGSDARTEVEVGDVTGDGLPDLVAATGSTLSVYPQQPDRSFAGPVTYPSGGLDGWTHVGGIALGDTNGDGRVDVHASVGGNKPNSWVVTRYQQPDGTLGSPVLRSSYDNPETLEVADVSGDGRGDLVVLHGGSNEVGVFDSTPGTNPAEVLYPIPYASHYDAQALAVADVTGDGWPDLSVADYNNGLVLLRANTATAPDTTITSGPSGTVRSTSATFTFASTPSGAGFQCSLDDAAWETCTSQQTWSGLATGAEHHFAVRAVSRGAVDATPATRTWTVAAAADLGVTLSGAPNPVKKGGTVTWTSTVSNTGPQSAADVVLTQNLPADLAFSSVSATPSSPTSAATSCTASGSPTTVRCALGSTAPGLSWTVTVKGTATIAKGSLYSTASAGTSTWDLASGNDAASATVTVGNGR